MQKFVLNSNNYRQILLLRNYIYSPWFLLFFTILTDLLLLLLFFLIYLFIYLFIFGCVGSSFLCEGFLQLRQVGATLHRAAQASHHRGFSRCGAQAPDAQAQQLWLTGPAAPRHVGSSQARARTCVSRISRQALNHCATREALEKFFYYIHIHYEINIDFLFYLWNTFNIQPKLLNKLSSYQSKQKQSNGICISLCG